MQDLMDRLTDSDREQLTEEAKDIDRAYANLTGKKKPAFERTEADKQVLEAAKAKRARKAAKRLEAASA